MWRQRRLARRKGEGGEEEEFITSGKWEEEEEEVVVVVEEFITSGIRFRLLTGVGDCCQKWATGFRESGCLHPCAHLFVQLGCPLSFRAQPPAPYHF